MIRHPRTLMCARPTREGQKPCHRLEHTAGLCAVHYKVAMAGKPTGRVDAGPTQAHIDALAALGVGTPRIAELVGMQQLSVWKIRHQGYVFASTAAKILALPLTADLAYDGAKVSPVGAGRRLQALQVYGYTVAELGERCGIAKRTVVKIMSDDKQFVTAGAARSIARVFTELQFTPGLNEVTKRRSLRKGWVPPLAWDEDEIDNPAAEPYRPTEADEVDAWHEDYLDLKDQGLTNLQIAERWGIQRDTLQKRLSKRLDSRMAA